MSRTIPSNPCPTPGLSRRDFFHTGLAVFGGLTLSNILHLRAATSVRHGLPGSWGG
jgi:hypothetical protein